MAGSAPNRVRTTEKSLKILECLQQKEKAGVTWIANELEMSKATVHNHLTTLETCGYVTQDEQAYRTSTKLLRLGEQIRERSPLYKAAQPEMARLAEGTNGVVQLYLKDGENATVIEQEGYHPNIQREPLGSQTPLTETIVGIVMLAEHHQRDRTTEEITTEKEIPPDVSEQFDHIEQRGYAVRSSNTPNVARTYAAGVSQQDGSVLGSLSVTTAEAAFDERMSPGEQLLHAVERAELSLTSWYDSQEAFSSKHATRSHSN